MWVGSVLIWIVSSTKRKLICLTVSLMCCDRRCIGIEFTCARSQHRPSRERKNKNDRLFHIKNYSAQKRPSNYQSPSSHHLCQVHNPLNGARRRGSELCCRFVGGANKFFV